MNKIIAVLAVAAVAAMAQSAWADTSDATCRYYKNGDKDNKRSGPCTFSQRQGNISIKLDSGDSIKLSPRNNADQFKDQDGDKVVRTGTYGNTQVYKWDDKNKKLIVNFNDTSYDGGHHGSRSDNLDDLEGMRASSGESELKDRGYYYRKTIKTSNSSIAYWWNPRKQDCIAVTTTDGRYKSIMNQPDAVCDDEDRDSDRHHGGGHGGTDDLVGMRASSGESELKDRGYRYRKTIKTSHSAIAYWWNPGKQDCIAVTTTDGRYKSIMNQPEAVCGD